MGKRETATAVIQSVLSASIHSSLQTHLVLACVLLASVNETCITEVQSIQAANG